MASASAAVGHCTSRRLPSPQSAATLQLLPPISIPQERTPVAACTMRCTCGEAPRRLALFEERAVERSSANPAPSTAPANTTRVVVESIGGTACGGQKGRSQLQCCDRSCRSLLLDRAVLVAKAGGRGARRGGLECAPIALC